ncbi:hypothetical protein GCM10027511_20500 [Hymenobacter humi]
MSHFIAFLEALQPLSPALSKALLASTNREELPARHEILAGFALTLALGIRPATHL